MGSNGDVCTKVVLASCCMLIPCQVNDYPLHRPMTIPQPPMPLHSGQLPPASGASSLPISTERHTSTGRLLPIDNQISSQKKSRLAPGVSAGTNPKLTPDDSMYNGYLPSPTSAHPSSNYRQNGHSSHQLSYNYVGVATSAPQQPFLPSSSFDFPSSSRSAPVSRTAGYNQRYPHHQDAQLNGIYHQLMRHNLPPGQASNGTNSRSQQSPDLLSAFLDNDDHRPPPTQSSQFAPLDWPSHGSSQQSQAPPATQQESGVQPPSHVLLLCNSFGLQDTLETRAGSIFCLTVHRSLADNNSI